jgi:hypothetical protein
MFLNEFKTGIKEVYLKLTPKGNSDKLKVALVVPKCGVQGPVSHVGLNCCKETKYSSLFYHSI